MKKILFLLSLSLIAGVASSHAGRTNSSGCHGGSVPYHCDHDTGGSTAAVSTTVVTCSQDQCKLGNTCYAKPTNAYCASNGVDAWACNDGYNENGDTCVMIAKVTATVQPTAIPMLAQNTSVITTSVVVEYQPTSTDMGLIEMVKGQIDKMDETRLVTINTKLIGILGIMEGRNKYVLGEIQQYIDSKLNPPVADDLSSILSDLFGS